MLEHIWSNLPNELRDELILQCVKYLKNSPEEADAFARLVADITKSRASTVKSQWRMSNIYGTKLALAREPQRASPFLAVTFMTSRKDDVAALYKALHVAHKDLAVEEASIATNPPTQAQFASTLESGIEGISNDVVQCMVAVIADAGIDAWQTPARAALESHLAARTAR